MWHPYSMRAFSIWCIKAGWHRGEVHLTWCLLRRGHCLQGGFCLLCFLCIALISARGSSKGRRCNLYWCNWGKRRFWTNTVKSSMRYFSYLWLQKVLDTQLTLFFTFHRSVSCFSLLSVLGIRGTNLYVWGRQTDKKRKKNNKIWFCWDLSFQDYLQVTLIYMMPERSYDNIFCAFTICSFASWSWGNGS